MSIKKIILFLASVAIPFVSFSEVNNVAQTTGDAAGIQSHPETFFWMTGIGLFVIFLFLIVLALGKAVMALSGNIGKTHHS